METAEKILADLRKRKGAQRVSFNLLLKKKTAIITTRLTPSEKAAIQRRAAKAKMAMTDYIIRCALGKEIIQVEGLDEILSELKAQGRNINHYDFGFTLRTYTHATRQKQDVSFHED